MGLYRRSNRARFLMLAAPLCLMALTHAAAQSCNAYLFPQSVSDVSVASVRADRLPVLRDDAGCPVAGSRCEGKAYLVSGNQVLVTAGQGGYQCAAYLNGKRQTTGWVARSALTPVPPPAPEGDWADTWKRVQGDAVLTIRRRAGQYMASGVATYAVQPDNVRTGTAEGTLRMSTSATGAVASFTQNAGDPTASCKVTLKQLGPWLLVNDGASDDANSGCGGMGVTFNGIYQRTLHAAGSKAKPDGMVK